MRHLRALLFVVIATVSLAGWAGQAGSGAADSDVIIQREQQRVKYLVSRDYDGFERMTSPTLTYSHSNGAMDTKETFIRTLRTGQVVFHSLNHRDLKVRFLTPDVAILNGLSDFEVTSGGQDQHVPLRFTIVYVKKNGEWLFEAWHSSRRAGE